MCRLFLLILLPALPQAILYKDYPEVLGLMMDEEEPSDVNEGCAVRAEGAHPPP